jgi:ATP-dependent DNA helicase 2 subunit 2
MLRKVSEPGRLIAVPPKKLAKRKRGEEVKPVSGLDIEALLLKGLGVPSEPKKQKLAGQIGLDDPSNDFKWLIDDEENHWQPGTLARDVADIVFNEMQKVIRDVISGSFADTGYEKAIKALKTYRQESIDVCSLVRG